VGRDYDPIKGQWFEDLEENEIFLVLSVDPDQEVIEIQYENGDIEEIDLDTWHELDLERAQEPEGWASTTADDDTDDEEELDDDEDDDDDDWDDDDDDDDDWDDDDEDMDDDYSDRDTN
jgi:segregation and condensation protein B